MTGNIRTFVELLQERPLRPAPRREENAHNVVELLPAVEGFLILLAALEDEDVDDARVGHIAVFLEVAADAVADERRGDVQCVDGANFRCLRVYIVQGKAKVSHSSVAGRADAVGMNARSDTSRGRAG